MGKETLSGLHCPLCKQVRPLTETDCCKRPICDPMSGVSGPFVPRESCWVGRGLRCGAVWWTCT